MGQVETGRTPVHVRRGPFVGSGESAPVSADTNPAEKAYDTVRLQELAQLGRDAASSLGVSNNSLEAPDFVYGSPLNQFLGAEAPAENKIIADLQEIPEISDPIPLSEQDFNEAFLAIVNDIPDSTPPGDDDEYGIDETEETIVIEVTAEMERDWRERVWALIPLWARHPDVGLALILTAAWYAHSPSELEFWSPENGSEIATRLFLAGVTATMLLSLIPAVFEGGATILGRAGSGLKSAGVGAYQRTGSVGRAVAEVPGILSRYVDAKRNPPEKPPAPPTLEELTHQARELIAVLDQQSGEDFDTSVFWNAFSDEVPLPEDEKMPTNKSDEETKFKLARDKVSTFFTETHGDSYFTEQFSATVEGLETVTEKDTSGQDNPDLVELSVAEFTELNDNLIILGSLYFRQLDSLSDTEKRTFLKSQGWIFDSIMTVPGKEARRGTQPEQPKVFYSKQELLRILTRLQRLEQLGEHVEFVSGLSPVIQDVWAGDSSYETDILRTPAENWELQQWVLSEWNKKISFSFREVDPQKFDADKTVLRAWRKKKEIYDEDKNFYVSLVNKILELKDRADLIPLFALDRESSFSLKRLTRNTKAEDLKEFALTFLAQSGTRDTREFNRRLDNLSKDRSLSRVEKNRLGAEANDYLRAATNIISFRPPSYPSSAPTSELFQRLEGTCYLLDAAKQLSSVNLSPVERARIRTLRRTSESDESAESDFMKKDLHTAVMNGLKGVAPRVNQDSVQRYIIAINHPDFYKPDDVEMPVEETDADEEVLDTGVITAPQTETASGIKRAELQFRYGRSPQERADEKTKRKRFLLQRG